MRPVNYRLEISSILVWMAACTVVAMQYTSLRGAMAAAGGSLAGCFAARWTARRGAHLEAAITLCPFLCALLLLACDGMHRAQSQALAQSLVWGGAAFVVSLALDLFRAEFPQAAAIRVMLILASFAGFLAAHCGPRPYSVVDFVLHAEEDPIHFFLLTGMVIAAGGVFFCLANPQLTLTKYSRRLTSLAALFPQGRPNPTANPNHPTGL